MKRQTSNIAFITKNQWVFHLIAIAVVLVVLSLAIQTHKDAPVQSMIVQIDPIKDGKYLIKKNEIEEIVSDVLGYSVEAASIKRLETMQLEAALNADPRVRHCDIFIDKKRNLHVVVKQREPIVKVLRDHETYYLDAYGAYVPTGKEPARVMVAKGAIPPYTAEYLTDESNSLAGVQNVAKLISEDDFLVSLVESMDVAESGEIILYPKVGRNKIKLGMPNDLEEKLGRLKIFYKKAIAKYGTDKYSELDIQYDDRVFCKPYTS